MRIIKLSLFAALASISIARPVFAANTFISINNAVTQTVHAADTFDINLLAGHSYVCEGIPSDNATEFSFNTSIPAVGAEVIEAPERSTLNVPITGGQSLNNRLVFTPTTTDRFRLTVQNAKVTTGETVKIRCQDSTLYGDYNTTVNSFNFLELTNTTGASITGKITATNFDGTVVINAQSFTITAKRRADFDIHTAAGANKFGALIVTSDAPFGALRGSLSEYSGTVSSFHLNATLPLKPIDVVP